MNIFLFLALALFSLTAAAELTYPVDHTAQWVTIDRNTCETIDGPGPWTKLDPDTYDCAVEPCGVDPGYPANFAALKVSPAGPFPAYDSNLARVESPFAICGPVTDSCYDARCTATDQLEQFHEVVDLTDQQRVLALNNQAASALLDSVSASERDLMIWLSVSMLMQLGDGATLPTDWQGVNFAALYTAYKAKYQETAAPVMVRRTELKERINDGTIQAGEISSGWPVPAE